jgi:hypothetical protein
MAKFGENILRKYFGENNLAKIFWRKYFGENILAKIFWRKYFGENILTIKTSVPDRSQKKMLETRRRKYSKTTFRRKKFETRRRKSSTTTFRRKRFAGDGRASSAPCPEVDRTWDRFYKTLFSAEKKFSSKNYG